MSEEQIINAFDEISIDPPQYLVDLYSWHNGITHLNPFLHFYSIEELVETVKINEKYETKVTRFRWSIDWLPIVTLNGDVQILINIATKELAALDLEMDSFKLLAKQYEYFVEAIYSVFKQEKYYYLNDGSGIGFNKGVWDDLLSKHLSLIHI